MDETTTKTALSNLEKIGIIKIVDGQIQVTPKGAILFTELTGKSIHPEVLKQPAATVEQTLILGQSITDQDIWDKLQMVLKPKYFTAVVEKNFVIVDVDDPDDSDDDLD